MGSSDLDALAVTFFREFARYEYCLKVTGLRPTPDKAKASWDKYANEVAHIFDHPPTQIFSDAVDYFKLYPPKKQIIKGGALSWDESTEPSGEPTAHRILRLVCRVRNNLFHGGKFNDIWFAPERSELLLRHALVILETCRDAHKNVKEAYEGVSDLR